MIPPSFFMDEAEWKTRRDRIDKRLRAAQRQVDALTPSLLARAFTGKLVPQDPTDEPADELLKRIHAQSKPKSHRDARK